MAALISHETPAHDPTALPVLVPQRLIGRDALLAKVYTALKDNQPVQIHGVSGIGKTALAATLAAAYTEQPGGVLWLNVEESSLDELIVRVGRAYAVPDIANSEIPGAMVGAVASTLTQHKPLLVLDGKISRAVIHEFVQRCVTNLPVLLVSENTVHEDWVSVEIGPLEASQAALLLAQSAGLPESPNPDIEALANALQRVPLALLIAGANLKNTKLDADDYLAALKQIPGAENANPNLLALTAAFRGQNSALQGILLMMGATFTRGASIQMLSEISNAPVDTLRQVMALLTQQHLVEQSSRNGEAYYSLHDATYQFAQSWLRGSKRLDDLQEKVKAAAIGFAHKHGTESPDYDKLAAEMPAFLAIARWAAGQKDIDTPNQIANALMAADDFISERGYVYELLQLRRLAASSTSAFPAHAPEIPPSYPREVYEAFTEDDLEEDFDDEDNDDSESLFLDDDDEDDSNEVVASDSAVFVPYPLEDLDLDEELEDEDDEDDYADEDDDDEDDEVFIPLPSSPGLPLTASRISAPPPEHLDEDPTETDSEAYARLMPEPLPDSIEGLRTQLIAARQSGNRRKQGEVLMALGYKQVEESMQNEALASYGEALNVYEEPGMEEELLNALDTVSTLAVQTNNAQAAILHAVRGVQLATQLEDDDTRMHLLITLGNARQALGESDDAERAYSQALEIARNRDDSQNEALILYKLGYAQLDNSDPDAASATWEQALQLFRDQGKRDYEGRVMGGLGSAYGELDRWAEAVSFHTSALYIAREVGDKDEEAQQLNNLGYAAVQTEKLGDAVLRYRQALHLAYAQNDSDSIVSTIVDLVSLLVKSPRHLKIAELLINDAAEYEPSDRDVVKLQDRIRNEILMEEANGSPQANVSGTARDYAENAYALLDS